MRNTLLACAALGLLAGPALGATLPPGFTETQVAMGLASPTAMAFAPDGRLFICEQGGKLRVVKNGQLLATPFVSLSVDSSGERGLIGVAIDPGFATNRFVYLYHTTTTMPRRNRVIRLTAAGDVAAAGSQVTIVDLDDLSSATNHNGGAMHFGADGKLYIAVGDNANSANAPSLATRHGKILRINKDGTIPGNNPFFGTASGANRAIWVRGLRNPFTFAFDSGLSRMFINDVGQNTWEEINDGFAGANYGWPTTEGDFDPASFPDFTRPLFAYSHDGGPGTGCAITGGSFYDPDAGWPSEFEGDFFYADFCSGWIRRYDIPSDTGVGADFASDIGSPVDLRFHADGGLYYLARGSGSNTGVVFQIVHTASQLPEITQQPRDLSVTQGQAATFSVAASGAVPLSYQWQRDQQDVAGAVASTFTLPSVQFSDDGALFRCVVTNSLGSATSDEATLTVTAGQPPVPKIKLPLAGTRYRGGQVISYSGKGNDPEDGVLPGSALTWEVAFHHDDHSHPFLPPTPGRTGEFTIPTAGETSANVLYRIHLTARDSSDNSVMTHLDLLPVTSTVLIETKPPGLQVLVDGQPHTAPYSFEGVTGMSRTIGAVTPQDLGGVEYTFQSWSDGLPATHDFKVRTRDRTYVATFRFPILPGELTSPTPGSTLTGSSATFQWMAGTGVTEYRLQIGNAPSGKGLLDESAGTALQMAVTGLPTDGRTLYVRLRSRIGGVWHNRDYVYTAAP